MNTVLLEDPVAAADIIRKGGLVAFPTETVYGLGADIFRDASVRQVFEAKGRPADNPLIAHIHAKKQVELLSGPLSGYALDLMDAFFPGPLTLVIPRSPAIPAIATAGLDSIGIRMPDHPVAAAFLQACDTPVAAPSANLSGRPSPTTWEAVREDLDRRIDAILKGGPSRTGLESTVVSCLEEAPVILRAGSLTLEALREVVPTIRSGGGDVRRSPGTRHRHYTPRAQVVLVDDPSDIAPDPLAGYIGLDAPLDGGVAFGAVCVIRDETEYAHRLFDFFRECERKGVSRIHCQRVGRSGLGAALMDRLERAAG